MKEIRQDASMLDALQILGQYVGKGKITIGIECENGFTNSISWKGTYSKDRREAIMIRAIKVLLDVSISKQEDA